MPSKISTMAPNFTLFILLITCLYTSPLPKINAHGFTIDLIPRDSPLSPLYNPSNTHFDNLHHAFRRAKTRSSSKFQAPLTSTPGEYLVNISIGTPPKTIVAVADTGSDITWTQCLPCTNCFKQNFPFFNPKNSSTYKKLPCTSKLCQAVESSSCSKNSCMYSASYGDRSYTNGDLAIDTFTFGNVSIPSVGFGCGHNDGGNFNQYTSGIVGLGGGPISIINQISSKIQGKFSYCLIPINEGSNVSSKLNFGSNAVVTGPGFVSTPLVEKDPVTFYYLSLDGVSVGDTKMKFSTKKYKTVDEGVEEDGNIIIDSGTTLTFLPSEFYDTFVNEVGRAIPATPINDSEGYFSLCYQHDKAFEALTLPTITFHFRGGADLNLRPSNTFLEVEKGVVCLVINPSDGFAIFGNLSQMDYLVGYDLVNKKVSFKPTDCTTQAA